MIEAKYNNKLHGRSDNDHNNNKRNKISDSKTKIDRIEKKKIVIIIETLV